MVNINGKYVMMIVIIFIKNVVLVWDWLLKIVWVVRFVWYKLVFVVVYFVIIMIINLDKFSVWKVILLGFNLIIDFFIKIVVFVFIIFVEI